MKKLLLAIFIMALSGVGFAQVSFSVGPKVGLGINSMFDKINGESVQEFYNELYADTDIKARVFNIGFLGGGFAEIRFGKAAVQVEYLFSGEGTGVKFLDTENNESYNDGDYDYTMRYKMTNIPVILKYQMSNNLNVYGGVQLASIREITEYQGVRSPDNKPEKIPEAIWKTQNKENWAAFVGGITAEEKGFIVDLRITVGPEIRKNPDAYSMSPASAQLSIGYKLFGK